MSPRREIERSPLLWLIAALALLSSIRCAAPIWSREYRIGTALHAYDYIQARATEKPLDVPCQNASVALGRAVVEANAVRQIPGAMPYQMKALRNAKKAFKAACAGRLP